MAIYNDLITNNVFNIPLISDNILITFTNILI